MAYSAVTCAVEACPPWPDVIPLALTLIAARTEVHMRKPNYHQARKQKELSRKARQQEKQQKREVRPEPDGISPQTGAPESPQVAESQPVDDPVGSSA
jgi:hypothetical protein